MPCGPEATAPGLASLEEGYQPVMPTEAKPLSARSNRRAKPSLSRTVEALRSIRGRRSRRRPEMQVIAVRRDLHLP